MGLQLALAALMVDCDWHGRQESEELSLGQDLYADIPEACLTDMARHRRMSLKCESALGQPSHASGKFMFDIVIGHLVIEHGLAVEFDVHSAVLADNLLGVPDVISDGRLVQDDDVIFVVGRRSLRAQVRLSKPYRLPVRRQSEWLLSTWHSIPNLGKPAC